MFAYINLCNPKNKIKLKLDNLAFNLEYYCWQNNVCPIDVLNNIKMNSYKLKILIQNILL